MTCRQYVGIFIDNVSAQVAKGSYPMEPSPVDLSLSLGSLSLGEAIVRLRAAEDPDAKVTIGMSANTAAAFDMHDAVHILFGCGTSLEGEIAAHVWMAFGTTAKIREMHRAIAQDEHRNVLAGIGHFTILRTWLRMLPRILRIVVRARRMTKPIAYERLGDLKEQSIATILREHGID